MPSANTLVDETVADVLKLEEARMGLATSKYNRFLKSDVPKHEQSFFYDLGPPPSSIDGQQSAQQQNQNDWSPYKHRFSSSVNVGIHSHTVVITIKQKRGKRRGKKKREERKQNEKNGAIEEEEARFFGSLCAFDDIFYAGWIFHFFFYFYGFSFNGCCWVI